MQEAAASRFFVVRFGPETAGRTERGSSSMPAVNLEREKSGRRSEAGKKKSGRRMPAGGVGEPFVPLALRVTPNG